MNEGRQVPGETVTSQDHGQMLRTGEVLAGRYRVEGLVGAGGMGLVYRVHDLRLDLPVALKLLRREHTGDGVGLKRFEQELVLARQVTHRNVVRIHDIGEDQGRHFLTMDYVEGRSLRQLMQEEGSLDPSLVAAIGRDLAEGLAAAHEQGVVHRDLKPGNVLVDVRGRALVTDFGVARSLDAGGLTRVGTVIGTLEYLAPEQARGEQVDGRADIYALGLLMFEMLTGELPFRGDTPEEIIAQRTTGRLRTLEECGAAAPAWLARVLARCLATDPQDRYPDAAALAADLGSGQASRRWARPSKGLVAAVAAGAAALALGVLLLRGEAPTDAPADAPVPPRDAERVVGVLPVANRTGQADFDWVTTGMAEMLAQGLADSPSLRVADSLRVFRAVEALKLSPGAASRADLRQLGDLLDVDRLVAGTVRQAGEVIRVELELVGVDPPYEQARTVSAETRDASGLFAVTESLGRQLRELLAAEATPAGPRVLSPNPVAMAAYAEGVEHLLAGDSVGAAPALERAVEQDPAFPAAWVRLSSAYEQLGYDDRALAAAREAVGRLGDSTGRVAFEARARAAALGGDYDEARRILEALVARYPQDLEARLTLAETRGEHGQLGEASAILKEIVAASPDHPRAWYLLGKYSILSGNSRAAADDYLVRALVIQNRLQNAQGRADVQNALGIAYYQLGEFELAEERYLDAVALRKQVGDERGVASALANIARLRLRKGDYGAARQGLEDALAAVERIGDRETVASLQNEIGFLEEQQGRYREALERYRKALGILRDLGDRRALAETYNNVGFGYYLLGEMDNAAVYAQQAIGLYTETDNQEGVMVAGQTVGLLELARGHWDDALKALLRVLELGRGLGDPQAEAMALGNIGRVAHFQGRYGAASSGYEEALEVVRARDDTRGLLEFTLFAAELDLDVGMAEAASGALARVEALLEEAGNHEQRAEWLRLRGRAQLLAGQVAEATRSVESAVEEAAMSGSVLARIGAGLGRGETLLAAGEAGAARAVLEPVYGEAEATGHLVLRLRAGEALARALVAQGHWAAAEARLRADLQLARAHAPYARAYRLHALMAEVMRRTDRAGEAAEQERAAGAELVRLRGELAPAQQAPFDASAEVSTIGPEENDGPAA